LNVLPATFLRRVLICAVTLCSACTRGGDQSNYVAFDEEIMATHISVVMPEPGADAAAREVFDVFQDVDARMSEWKTTSALSAVNHHAGKQAVAVPTDLRNLIRRAVDIGDLTDGAFDITWAALWGLWDFRAEHPSVPRQTEIDERLSLINYRLIEIDDHASNVYLPREGMVLGLGGIAKGYALDLAAGRLRARGVQSFLIGASGQMMAGTAKGDMPWRIGIRDPRGTADDYFAYLEVTDVSISTSGDYERFFMLDGLRYHHILDPRTGKPARPTNPLRSATVIAADAVLADALSTAFIILGTQRALELSENIAGVEAVLVDGEARVHITSGLAGKLEILHPPAR
jgi:thiamine biosynthesis lipoprotein